VSDKLEPWEQILYEEVNKAVEQMLPLYRPPEGSTKILFRMDTLRNIRTRFGDGLAVNIETEDGKKYTLLLRRGSRIYRAFIGFMTEVMKKYGRIPRDIQAVIDKRGDGYNVEYRIHEAEANEQPRPAPQGRGADKRDRK